MNQTKATIEHDEIRRWAEARGASPARVKGTGGEGDVGMIRLDFPGYSGKDSLEPISWDQFFEKFEEGQLALVYREQLARGGTSNFNKLVGRETVDIQGHSGRRTSPGRRRTKAPAGASSTGRTPRTSRAAGSRRGTTTRGTATKRTTKAAAKKASGARSAKPAKAQKGRAASKRAGAKRVVTKRAAPAARAPKRSASKGRSGRSSSRSRPSSRRGGRRT